MKKYFKFKKEFRAFRYSIQPVFDTSKLYKQTVEHDYPEYSKHDWFRCKEEYLADIFLFESEGESQEYVNRLNRNYKNGYAYLIKKEDEYDSLEELVDEYIVVEKENISIHLNYDEVSSDDLRLLLQDHDIYGAVWVEMSNGAPRLEPVAKMNEKGELELL